MHTFRWLLIVTLLVGGLMAAPAELARANNEPELGYLWSLEFDFEQNFNGVLTIEVGPWENGNLVSVDETSTSVVGCQRVGVVFLSGGNAVFDGGHLECDLDLRTAVFDNHGLELDPVDSYGSMLVRGGIAAAAPHVAPIISHPDAVYAIDFSQTQQVKMGQNLSGGGGWQHTTFPVAVGMNWHPYTFQYDCIWNGPCNATFRVGPHIDVVPTLGDRVEFQTGPTTLLIGGDGATTFDGRMSHLLIDPGNIMH